MNNQIIIVGLLLVSMIFSVLPIGAQPDDNNPFTMQWWYQARQSFLQPQQPDRDVYQDDDDDNDDNERLDVKFCGNSGTWDGKKCVIEDPEEKAAYEDAVCDDPKDTQKYRDVCGGGGSSDDDFTNREHLSTDTDKEKKWSEYVAQLNQANPQYFAPADNKDTNPAEETGPTEDVSSNTITFDFSDDKPDNNDDTRNNDDDDDKNKDDDNKKSNDSDDSSNDDDSDSDSNDGDDDGSSSDKSDKEN